MTEKKNKKCWETGKEEDCGVKTQPSLNKKQFNFSFWYFILLIVFIFILNSYITTPKETLIDFSEFKNRIESGEIKRVEIGGKKIVGYTLSREPGIGEQAPATIYKTIPVDDPQFVPLMDGKGVKYSARSESANYLVNFLLSWVIPLAVMIVIWRLLFKRMGNMGGNVLSFGQNRSQIVAEGQVDVTFDDVAGADEAKAELIEVVDFLKNPEKYRAIGGKIPKGVLLVGPPGGGKTLMARALAGEAGVTFFKISGADFVELFVGVGAARVRDMFRQARQKAPCIIFIDELDAIGKSRVNAIAGNDEREQTLNQLLVEMDGFDSRQGVIILGATNRPEVLDPALLRAGRFDRQVVMDRPDLLGREAILKIHTQDVKLDETVDIKKVAQGTPGFVGADLANLVNEAALLAVRSGRDRVSKEDFDEAIEKLMAGLQRKTRVINPREREIVAYHETGHALTAFFTKGADPVHKISIVPRGVGALGYTLQLPTEDRYLMTQDELLGRIDVLLGGRVAEQLIFEQVSTGAANDLTRATDIARKIITDYGMSEKFRNIVLTPQRGPAFLGDRMEQPYPYPYQREYSENTQQYIDEETTRIVNDRYQKVTGLLKEKMSVLKKIALKLLEVETLDREEFKALIQGGGD